MLQAFMKVADKFDAKHGRSTATAHRQLEKEGIVTPSGRLTRRFGG